MNIFCSFILFEAESWLRRTPSTFDLVRSLIIIIIIIHTRVCQPCLAEWRQVQ